MGIDLGDVVIRHPTSLRDLSGQRLAVDAWNVLYQFLASIRQPDGSPLRDREGRVTSHLAGLLYRTAGWVEAGVKPVFVFDGPPHPLKAATLRARSERKEKAEVEYREALAAGDLQKASSKAQQTSRMTPDMVVQAQALLSALGLPWVQAPGEGEAQASWMVHAGVADGIVSQDYDALLFGAPRIVRNLGGGRRKMPGKQVWVDVEPEIVDLNESLAALSLSRDQLIDAALLVGTDFHTGIKGIGAKKAVQMIRDAGTLETLLDRLAAQPSSAESAVEKSIVANLDVLENRAQVRKIFAEPAHIETGKLDPKTPDEAAVTALMVDTHGFSADRVAQTLARYAGARGKQAQKGLFDF